MTMQFESALGALRDGGVARNSGEKLQARLDHVGQLLNDDLARVEEALVTLCGDGPAPAPAAAQHLVAGGGKRVRPLSLLLSARCFVPRLEQRFFEMAAVVELVHSATLLHDDVIDEGMERRGVPTSRRLYGNGVSVLSGDLLLVSALDRTRSAAPSLLGELIETLRRLVHGEIIQLRSRTELDVRESNYITILEHKTASLFAFAAGAGAAMAGAPSPQCQSLNHFGEQLGIAFQLVDDVLDYEAGNSGKNLFADLVEGKMTLPLVLAIQRDPQLGGLVAQIHAGDRDVVDEVSARVLRSGACDSVRKRATEYTDRAVRALEALPDCAARDFLRAVAHEMTGRTG